MNAPIAIIFANLKGNVGDFAILHAMLLDITSKYPGHSIHVFTHGFHPIDDRRAEAFARTAPAFEIAGTTFVEKSSPSPLMMRLPRMLGQWSRFQGRRIDALARKSAASAQRFQVYEAIFLAGGAQWTGMHAGISMFGTLRAIHSWNDRIFGFPFSVYPSVEKMNIRSNLKADLARVQPPLIVRDSRSKAVIDSLELGACLGADCVYSLQDCAEKIAPMPGRDNSRVVIATTQQSREVLQAAVQRLQAGGLSVALLTTCALEDAPVMAAVAHDLGVPFHEPLTWQEVVAEMKASALVVTNRLHGLIFGSFTATPLLPVTNRGKSSAFALDAGAAFSVSSLADLDTPLVERCLHARDEILTKIHSYRESSRRQVRSPLVLAGSALP